MTQNITVDAASGTVDLSISGTFTADQLRELLQHIGNARAQIAQDPTDPATVTHQVAVGVRWTVDAMPNDPNTAVFRFLLPWFGWVGVGVTAHDRCLIAHYLIGQQANALAAAAAIPAASAGGTLH